MKNENSLTTGGALATQPKLTATLNGGSDVLESALIPVQFGVNAALAEIQPTHILVIIQHKSEMDSSATGIRKLIPLTRGSDFICFDSAGEHTVTFVALKSSDGAGRLEKRFERYLKEYSPGSYRDYVNLKVSDSDPMFRGSIDNSCVVAVFSKAISLPPELFAVSPKTWVWNWVNLWYRYEPTDVCSYRERLVWAFTLKPIGWIMVVVAKYLWALMSTVWLVGAKIAVFIAGWRPEPIFRDLDKIWTWEWNPGSIDWDILSGEKYGVWSRREEKFFPITGGALLTTILLVAIPYVAFWRPGISNTVHNWALEGRDPSGWYIVCTLLEIFTLVLFAISWFRLRIVERGVNGLERIWDIQSAERRKARAEALRREADLGKPLYFEWLNEALGADRLPSRVDLGKVPAAFKQPTIHKFRLSFNALKAKVCKPFPRR